MKWLEGGDIYLAAMTSDKEAVKCTVKHWNQIYKATKAELTEGLKDCQVGYNSDWCALCTRFYNKRDVGLCPFCEDKDVLETMGFCDGVCNDVYWDARTALSLFRQRKLSITDMRKQIKPVIDKLTEIYYSYPKEK